MGFPLTSFGPALGSTSRVPQLQSEWLVRFGTKRTSRADLAMSVDRGRPEVAFRGRQDRFRPISEISLEAVCPNGPLFGGTLPQHADLALRNSLPAIYLFPEFAKSGGLIGYGPDLPNLFTQGGLMTRKVLQGAAVAD